MVMNLSLGEHVDIDDDLENVTKELRGLKMTQTTQLKEVISYLWELIGNYDSRAMTLQTELRLAHDECCDLLCYPKETFNLQTNLTDGGNCCQVDHQTLPYVAQMIGNANKASMKAEEKIRRLRKEMRMHTQLDVETSSIIDEGVQTDELSHVSELPSSLTAVKEANRFSSDLMDVVFGLSSQLSQCHAQRDVESREHERFVQTLNDQFEENFKKVRKQNFRNLHDVKEKIRSTYKLRMSNMITQNKELFQRLSKAETLEQNAQCTISRLQREVYGLIKRLKSMSEENSLQI